MSNKYKHREKLPNRTHTFVQRFDTKELYVDDDKDAELETKVYGELLKKDLKKISDVLNGKK